MSEKTLGQVLYEATIDDCECPGWDVRRRQPWPWSALCAADREHWAHIAAAVAAEVLRREQARVDAAAAAIADGRMERCPTAEDRITKLEAERDEARAELAKLREESRLMTWDEAMAWATEGGGRRNLLGWWAERRSWMWVYPLNDRFEASTLADFEAGELTNFRKLPPAPEGK